MSKRLKNWETLPKGDLQTPNIVMLSEWEVPDRKTQIQAIDRIIAKFNAHSLDHNSIKGKISHNCFLDKDSRHILNFSQWKDQKSIDYFEENNPKNRICKILKAIPATKLSQDIYYPFKTYGEDNYHIKETGLIVIVKQFFEKSGLAEQWISKILKTLIKEKQHDGLIQNTYYLNEERTELINYALWHSDVQYGQFLQHNDTETKKDWEDIKNFKGLLYQKGSVRRYNEFIKIYG